MGVSSVSFQMFQINSRYGSYVTWGIMFVVWILCEYGNGGLFSILGGTTPAILGVSDSQRYYERKMAFCLGQAPHEYIEQLLYISNTEDLGRLYDVFCNNAGYRYCFCLEFNNKIVCYNFFQNMSFLQIIIITARVPIIIP